MGYYFNFIFIACTGMYIYLIGRGCYRVRHLSVYYLSYLKKGGVKLDVSEQPILCTTGGRLGKQGGARVVTW